MGLPMVIAMLINLKEVDHIVTARLEPGDTQLAPESLKEKKILIRDHLSEIEGGDWNADDIQAYAGMVLKTSSKLRESLRLAKLILFHSLFHSFFIFSHRADLPSTSRGRRNRSPKTPTPDKTISEQ